MKCWAFWLVLPWILGFILAVLILAYFAWLNWLHAPRRRP
ncbi:hypothetical protein Deipe_1451 [Deinococcus peraridilitoris DSM 19664]|uniref:Uncharacterized protein n=1 Tax=Deinococcus peraridilitoris (strain DSM 19664 / LMG 22246 / CIP 109416 / KR-200) TaxID=937777 RepID=L0A1D3_DEIPD|nr:hypothetical protein Deipe_1451 [Deinococcus peraridilitoris DSM 19664]